MLTKMWTGSLLFLLFASLVALAVAVAYEKDFHPLRDFAARFRRLPFGKQLAVIVFVCAMWAYASIKPGNGGGGDGGGGTNNVPQMVPGPGNLDPMSLPGGGLQGLQGQAHLNPELHPINQPVGGEASLNLVSFEPITSTNTTRTL
ncbi:MAG: hypothetical protein IIT36_01595, partial [Aeriscardovia sp.]|nr:hypothetical protein [Aeriscardovia sp.]